jgi:hypothetical protein
VKLRAGEYKLLTLGCRVIRLATSDPSVCGAAHYDGRTLALWGRTRGTSDVTLWFEDAARGPVVWAVEVR